MLFATSRTVSEQPSEAGHPNARTQNTKKTIKTMDTETYNKSSTIAIIITCYNYGRYLEEAVLSALSQVDAHVDIIIVDYKSTDDSLAVARRLSSRDRRITVLAHEQNRGPVQAFNSGLAATGSRLLRALCADSRCSLLRSGPDRMGFAVLRRNTPRAEAANCRNVKWN